MELFIYHYTTVFYYFTGITFIARFILNTSIYFKIDSDVTNVVPDQYEFLPPTESEKESLRKTRKYVNDLTYEKNDGLQFLYLSLTFWWPIESHDSKAIATMKKIGNSLNVIQILQLILMFIVFLYFQDNNLKFKGIPRDPLYFLRNK